MDMKNHIATPLGNGDTSSRLRHKPKDRSGSCWQNRPGFGFLCSLILLFTINSCPSMAQPRSGSIIWDDIKQISFDTAYSVTPIVLCQNDTVHLFWYAWMGGESDGGYLYRRSVNGGLTFQPLMQLVRPESVGAMGPPMVSMVHNYLYLLYSVRVDSPEYYNLALRRSTDGGSTWEPRQIISAFGPANILAQDSAVYLYFNYTDLPYERGGMHRSHDYGLTWDTVYNLYPVASISSLVKTAHRLHYVMERGMVNGDFEVLYRWSTDDGSTFSGPDTLSDADGVMSDEAHLIRQEEGRLYIVYRDGKYGAIDEGYHLSVLLRQSTDEGITWSKEDLLTMQPSALFPKIAAEDSLVAVGWNDYVDEFHERTCIRMSYDCGLTWSDTEFVNMNAGDVDLALGNGILHTTWFADGEIYYRRGLLPPYAKDTVAITVTLDSHWNIVSLPVLAQDTAVSSILPLSTSPAFSYEVGTYQENETMTFGRGYWVKMSDTDTVTMVGGKLYEDTIDINPGWNLIGSISYPISVTGLSTIPPGVISSDFYAYEGSYRKAEVLVPGRGYWMKASTLGKLVLQFGR
jgi:hypothetical protein